MTIEFDYELRERVWIPELACRGTIMEICLNWRGIEYRVDYWLNGEQKTAWLDADQLHPLAQAPLCAKNLSPLKPF